MEIKRQTYLEKLVSSIGNGMVKIITGPRRSGKSYLLFNLFIDYLKNHGVNDDHIIGIKLDRKENARYRDLDELEDYFNSRRTHDGKTQFFIIDEIQLVPPKENPWVKGQKLTFYDLLNQFLDYKDTEVFVTGSNSHLLSSDIATEFRGRGWQIHMHPLSFSEFLSTKTDKSNLFALWDEYWRYGGLPRTVLIDGDSAKMDYLLDTFRVTYLRDIIDRYRLRNDEATLGALVRVLASSVGSPVSFSKIANTFRSSMGYSIAPRTVERYIRYMEDAFLIEKAQADSLKGRKVIGAPSKYYFNDLGIRFAATEFKGDDQEPHYMENIIYNDLISRGYIVNTGRLSVNERDTDGKQDFRQYEIDFVSEKGGERIYIQSAMVIPGDEKMTQEKRPLLMVHDSFRKVLVSKYFSGAMFDNDGILQVGLFDFLTKPELLSK